MFKEAAEGPSKKQIKSDARACFFKCHIVNANVSEFTD